MGTQGTGRKRNPNKDRSTAEDDTLNLIAREAEARLALKRAARAEAREIRMKELERQQEEVEDRDFLEKGSQSASTRTAATLASLSGSSSRRGSGESPITGDTETSILEIKDIHDLKDQIQDVESKYMQSLKEVKDSLVEVEEKYRKAMVSNAQLDNEKNNLMYQVDRLKDSLMELEELLSESRREYDGMTKDFEREKHAYGVLQFQFNVMKETLKQSEELLTVSPPRNTPSLSDQPKRPQLPPFSFLISEFPGLLTCMLIFYCFHSSPVKKLKAQVEQKKLRNGTEGSSPEGEVLKNGTDPHIQDLQRDASRQLSDLKFKLVKSEQEVTALEQNVTRLEGQVTRYKGVSENAEKVEDELKAEKRKLQRELRSTLDKIDELESNNSHLSKRLDKMKANRTTAPTP
uniref:Leucine-rich repeat flightless-interacting protein 2-like n=1 Tax=Salmo trutta TaxID=8032 RepID=A0A673Y5C1_SALTR